MYILVTAVLNVKQGQMLEAISNQRQRPQFWPRGLNIFDECPDLCQTACICVTFIVLVMESFLHYITLHYFFAVSCSLAKMHSWLTNNNLQRHVYVHLQVYRSFSRWCKCLLILTRRITQWNSSFLHPFSGLTFYKSIQWHLH